MPKYSVHIFIPAIVVIAHSLYRHAHSHKSRCLLPHFVNDSALKELWSCFSLSVEVESDASVATHSKVVVHCDVFSSSLQSKVASALDLNLPSENTKTTPISQY